MVYILCILLPPLAVYMRSLKNGPVFLNFFLLFFFFVPAIIHAFIIVLRNKHIKFSDRIKSEKLKIKEGFTEANKGFAAMKKDFKNKDFSLKAMRENLSRDESYKLFLKRLKQNGDSERFNYKSIDSGATTLDRYNQLKSNKEKFYLYYNAMETLESEYIHFKIEQEYWKDRKDWSSYYDRYFEDYDNIFVKYSDWYDKQKSPSLETLQEFLNEKNRIQNKIWEMENFEEQLCKIRGITKSLAKTIAKEYNYDREKIGEAGVEGLSKINGVGKTMAEEIIKRKVLL